MNPKNKKFINEFKKIENFSEELVLTYISFLILKSLSHWSIEPKKKDNVILTSINIFNVILEYHKKFSFFYEMKYFKEDREIFIIILGFLSKKKIISETQTYDSKKKKTYIIYTIMGPQISSISFNIFNSKPYIRNGFVFFTHYSASFEVVRENKKSGSRFKLHDESYFMSLYEQEIYLDVEELTYHVEDIISIENLNKDSFFEDIRKNLEDLYQKLLEAYKNIWKNKHLIAEINKEISKKMLFYKLFSFHDYCVKRDFSNRIYIPIYFDFRGRRYYDSPVSPTSHSFFRQIYHYGFYTEYTYKNTPIVSSIILKYIKKIEEKVECKLHSNKIVEACFWIIISISYIKRDKTKISYSIEEFLDVEWNEDNLNIKDLVLYRYLHRILYNVKRDKLKKMHIIPKDATASVYQQLMLLLGAKDDKSYEICNLSGDNWIDTYSYILNKFKENNIERYKVDKKYAQNLDFLNRSNTKATIMTAPYASTRYTCFEYFTNIVNKEVSDDLREVFYEFYSFINEDLEVKELFGKKSDSLINMENFIIHALDSSVDLKYHRIKSLRIDKIIKINKINKVRITSKYNLIDKENIDKKKILSSFRANLIHFKDAETIRKLEYLMSRHFMTIHDCFLVDVYSISNFIYHLNLTLQKDSNRFNLFIVV